MSCPVVGPVDVADVTGSVVDDVADVPDTAVVVVDVAEVPETCVVVVVVEVADVPETPVVVVVGWVVVDWVVVVWHGGSPRSQTSPRPDGPAGDDHGDDHGEARATPGTSSRPSDRLTATAVRRLTQTSKADDVAPFGLSAPHFPALAITHSQYTTG
ncbi:hypothetical protein GCM10018963_13950 [Saccharothrix longispora]